MIALLQRVDHAHVVVDDQQIAAIKQGLLVFIGIERGDQRLQADRLVNKLLNYRVFSDADDKMNLSLLDIDGELLLVPQFTLAADTQKGLRPSFSHAASPHDAKILFDYFCHQAKKQTNRIASGQFAADMHITLTNNGPVTFYLHIPPSPAQG